MKNLSLIFFYCLIILTTTKIYSDELNKYKFAFIDIENDIRYSQWGVHPVDIRSKYNKQKRSIDGALLGLNDIKALERIAKTNFSLKTLRASSGKDVLQKIEKMIEKGI